MKDSSIPPSRTTIDRQEVRRFADLAEEWWDPNGKFRPLHKLGPVRLSYIRDQLTAHFNCNPLTPPCLQGLRGLDIGCGGGLIAEPLARLGAELTAIDPGESSIQVARDHAAAQGLTIDYRCATVEELVAENQKFDFVLCLEVVEHVPDVGTFLKDCAELIQPKGMMILSTLNRTMKSFVLAILGAEYILRWLPVGTHQWDRFVTPEELEAGVQAAGLARVRFRGLVYHLLQDEWQQSSDLDVNYFAAAIKEEQTFPKEKNSEDTI